MAPILRALEEARQSSGSFLSELEAPLRELSHPLGGLAFNSTALSSRRQPPSRELLRYEPADSGTAGEEKAGSAAALLSDEAAAQPVDLDPMPTDSAPEGQISDSSMGFTVDAATASTTDHPVDNPAAASAAAVEASSAPGTGDAKSTRGNSDEGAGAAGGKKRPNQHRGGVDLPLWLDLDQETLPHARQPPISLHPGKPVQGPSSATQGGDAADCGGGSIVSVTSQSGKRRLLQLPSKLGDFGSVGELTVQLRTANVPAALQESSFDEQLKAFEQARAKRAAAAAAAAAPTSGEHKSQAHRRAPDNSYVCHNCGVGGHWREQCPSRPKTVAGDEGQAGAISKDGPRRGKRKTPDGYLCHNCQQPGHWREDCPQPPQACAGGDQGDSVGEVQGKKRKGAKREHAGPPEGYVCNMCNQSGHWIQQCPLRPAEKAIERPPPPAGYVCKKCNVAGHWIELCSIKSVRAAQPSAVPELTVSAEAAELGEEIAEALEETDQEAVQTIRRVVAALGEEAARMLLVQAWQVEEQGGLLRLDGSGKRRTAGGVFLWLVKQQATDTQRLQIWPKPQVEDRFDSGGEAGRSKKRNAASACKVAKKEAKRRSQEGKSSSSRIS